MIDKTFIKKIINNLIFEGEEPTPENVIDYIKKTKKQKKSKVKSKNKKTKEDGEIDELVDASGSFIGSEYPILDQGLHPRKTMDVTVASTRQTNNPILRGYRVYYGESEEKEKTIDEVNYENAFGFDEVDDEKTFADADKVLDKELGIEDEENRKDRLDQFGFDPELDKELKNDKKNGKCKKCFTKRRLSELQNQKMEKLLDEILLDKKKNSSEMVEKEGNETSPVEKILMRNLESIKTLADKEGIDINKLVRHLKK